MPDKITPDEIKELEFLETLLDSKGWRYIKSLLHSHHLHCVKTSNVHLEKHEDRKAGEWLARSKEQSTFLNMVTKRKNDLLKQRKQERG